MCLSLWVSPSPSCVGSHFFLPARGIFSLSLCSFYLKPSVFPQTATAPFVVPPRRLLLPFVGPRAPPLLQDPSISPGAPFPPRGPPNYNSRFSPGPKGKVSPPPPSWPLFLFPRENPSPLEIMASPFSKPGTLRWENTATGDPGYQKKFPWKPPLFKFLVRKPFQALKNVR